MRTFSRLSVLTGILILPATQARSQDAGTIADVRCIVVATALAQMANPSQQSSGTMLMLYFMGRLDGRSSKLNLEDLMVKEFSKMTPSDYTAETRRCGSSLQEKGQQISLIGKHMVERAQKKPDPAAAARPSTPGS